MSAPFTLLLMRHAKSNWDDSQLADHDRPLNKRGRRDAPRMGRYLVEQQLIPQKICCSSAVRTRETAELVAAECGHPKIEVLPHLYHAGVHTWRDLFAAPDLDSLTLFIGHNPGIEEFVSESAEKWVRVPTATISVMTINDVADGEMKHLAWQVQAVWRPKEVLDNA